MLFHFHLAMRFPFPLTNSLTAGLISSIWSLCANEKMTDDSLDHSWVVKGFALHLLDL